MAVAEFVPEVPVFEGASIALGEEAPSGYRLQQVEMRRLRLVPPGDQPVDDAEV